MAMLRSLLLLFTVFSMGNADVDKVEKCPYGWTNFGVRCFRFFSQQVNWITAEKNCQSLDANLASVHNKLENDFLLSLLPSSTLCWMGAHDGEQDGQWLWSDGTPNDYTNWCPGEPNNSGSPENCGEINFSSDIAEKCPYGWTNFGVRCFKFFSQQVNWITAEDGQWLWSDGTHYDYTNWCPGEPNNYGSPENCGEINFLWALLKYFGASSATCQDEAPTSPTTQDSAGMASALQDELPSVSSASHMSPQTSNIEDEDIFASTSTLHKPSEVELMAKFDPIIKDHLNRVERGTASHNSYLGHHVQNELIDLLSSKIISDIVDDIKQAKFFSIILDCTPDISHIEQLSVVIRVVSLMEMPHIREHFMGFLKAEESTGQHLASMILTRLEELGIPFDDCRGKSYDNGANMKGKNKGVQARLLEKNPRALFVPCGAHTLNLVVCDAAKGSVDAMSYIGVLQKLSTLFSASSQRWSILKNHVSITLKMWAETRWESKVKSVEPMRYHGAAVREALTEVRDNTKDPAIKAEAQSLSEQVGSYRFSICTVVWYDVLSAIQHVSKLMQSSNMHVDLAVNLLKKTEQGLQSYRASGFVTAQMAAKDICEEMNVEAVLKQKG
ncbi:zinc finger MYM-type 1-like protein [Labeo rohita]|uniref:Zinc finger MYM-type 1-like protein n=1 Tax=Labeo rohita TaxID=84645 RepID=A0A498P1X0_LABRO|nr:zinc finger MYM-type 1-like protein [Labeo rohita]